MSQQPADKHRRLNANRKLGCRSTRRHFVDLDILAFYFLILLTICEILLLIVVFDCLNFLEE